MTVRTQLSLYAALAIAAVFGLPGGCPPSSSTDGPTFVGQVAPPLSALPVKAGSVRVEVRGAKSFTGKVTVEMRAAQQLVHTAQRTVQAGGAELFIGPDRVELVTVNGSVLASPAIAFGPREFRLGSEFQPGDTILIDLEALIPVAPPPPVEPNEPPPDPNQAPPPVFQVVQPAADVRVAVGASVIVQVEANGLADGDILQALADPDSDPNNGNELFIGGAPASSVVQFSFETGGLAQGAQFRLLAVLVRGGERSLSPAGPGRVLLNVRPALVFSQPAESTLWTRGKPLRIAVLPADADDNATAAVFADLNNNGLIDGADALLGDNISEDDPAQHSFEFATDLFAVGSFRVLGRIQDGIETVTQLGPRVCLTQRLAGRIGFENLVEGEIATVQSASDDTSFEAVALGAAIDASADLDRDGISELLIGDPAFERLSPDGGGVIGAAFLHRQGGVPWPRTLTLDDLTLRIEPSQIGSGFGSAVGFADTLDDSYEPELLLGAPTGGLRSLEEGTAYILSGGLALSGWESFLPIDSVKGGVGRIWGDAPGENAGAAVTPVGDVNGDSYGDFAVGAPGFDTARGRVGVVVNFGSLPFATLSDLSDPNDAYLPGAVLKGEQPGDEAGAAILRNLAEFNGFPSAGPAALAVGAPGQEGDRGAAYIVLGGPVLASNSNYSLSLVGSQLPGLKLLGEAPGERAGSALALIDLNGDGLRDLVVGAPRAEGDRGRVYVVFQSPELTAKFNQPAPSLALVGNELPGVVLTGESSGDLFGWSIANGGDVDGDGFEDLLIGAPGAGQQRGAAYLVYGGSASGPIAAEQIGTCDVEGWRLLGSSAGSRLGQAVSISPDLTGDGLGDAILGSPGDALEGGSIRGRVDLIIEHLPPLPSGT